LAGREGTATKDFLGTRRYRSSRSLTKDPPVRLESILLQTIGLRLREPFRISSGVTHERRILLARLSFDAAEGIGECVAGESPDYSAETVETATLVLMDQIGAYVDQGYRRVKLKIAPGRDLTVLDAVRHRFPDIPLTVDANAAYGARDLDRLAALDDFGLEYVEQPFPPDELLLHARLQEDLDTAVCLDESITSAARCRDALALGACRVVNIKPGRLGGHGVAREVHDLCAGADVPVWCGGMLESGVGRAHNVALASLPNMRLPGDTSASDRYWDRDIIDPPFVLEPDGTVAVPTGPGIGVVLDESALAAAEIDRVSIRQAAP
jgi:L-alanine-DL-glutamate epimerase-like enolase superfamily enzyme